MLVTFTGSGPVEGVSTSSEWLAEVDWLVFWSIPAFTAAIGLLINWTGLVMLFSPVGFHGVRVPGLRELSSVLPRKVQEVPGIMQGGVGWQGIIPARAAKMGSIAVDKAISKLGTPAEFYQNLEPDRIAEHIVELFGPELPGLIEDVMRAEHPALWRDLPPAGRRAVVARVREQLPAVVRTITTEIGHHIDQLLDPKIMVIEQFRQHPALVVRIFRDFGQRELNLMVWFGGIFGFLLGIPVAVLDLTFHQWWLLPVLGVVVGWATNALGMWLIFEPPDPRRVGGVSVHGLFPRRQPEAADVYADIIADDVITLENIGDFLLNGPRGDRTRQLLVEALGPAIDRAAGVVRPAVKVALGRGRYEAIRSAIAREGVEHTLTPFRDREFGRAQADRIRALIASRTRQLPPRDFVEMMRAAIREDEWLLYAHGAIMGFGGGLLHLWIFGVGGG